MEELKKPPRSRWLDMKKIEQEADMVVMRTVLGRDDEDHDSRENKVKGAKPELPKERRSTFLGEDAHSY